MRPSARLLAWADPLVNVWEVSHAGHNNCRALLRYIATLLVDPSQVVESTPVPAPMTLGEPPRAAQAATGPEDDAHVALQPAQRANELSAPPCASF